MKYAHQLFLYMLANVLSAASYLNAWEELPDLPMLIQFVCFRQGTALLMTFTLHQQLIEVIGRTLLVLEIEVEVGKESELPLQFVNFFYSA